MKRYLIPSLCTALALLGASASAVNLIQNGSFEIGPDPGTFISLGNGNTSITGWTVGGAGIDYIGTYWQPQDGARSIDLNQLNLGSVSQQVTTVAGQLYRISFWMSGNPDGNNSNSQFLLNFNAFDTVNNATVFSQNASYQNPHTRTNMLWEQRTFEFTASSSSTLLTFAGVAPPGAFGAALDNISMEAVPEPFTMALMGGAAATAFARVRRRNRKVA